MDDAAHAARRDRHADRLAELGEMAMDIARRVHGQVIAQVEAAEPGPEMARALGDLTRMFDRAARAARLTYMLEARLAQAPVGASADPAPGAPDPWRDEAGEARRQRKMETREIVRRVIEAEVSDCVRRNYFGRLDERLEREHQPDFTWKPLGEMVARICRDLGLDPDWSRWDEAWSDEAVIAFERSRPRLRDPVVGPRPPRRALAARPAEPARAGPS